MGRTIQTAVQVIDAERQAFSNFRRTLRKQDQHYFDLIFAKARKHAPAISQANHALPFEVILLAMAVEQAKEIDLLTAELRQLRSLLHD